MPLHGLHHRSNSNTNSPEAPPASSSLIQAAQALAGIGAPKPAGNFQQPQQQHSQQQHQQSSRGGDTSLRVQTSSSNLNVNTSSSGGITPIHSGSTVSAGGFSAPSSAGGVGFGNSVPIPQSSIDKLPAPLQIQQQPTKKNLSFNFPSPTKLPNQGDLYSSPVGDYSGHRPSDPIQAQQLSSGGQQPQYQAYHAAQPSSATGGRPQIQNITTAPGAVPQIATSSGGGIPAQQGQPSMHRTNTTGGLSHSSSNKYSPNINTNLPRDAESSPSASGSRKYTHPGALTPTYTNSSQHSHSGSTSTGMGLPGMTTGSSSSTREREDVVGGIGAVGNGRWMSPYALYALDWCKWPVSNGGYGRVAMCSYAEDSHNYIQILDTRPTPVNVSHGDTPPPAPSLEFSKLAEASHTYPITRILWEPASTTKPLTDLIATSGDHLRLWSMPNAPSGTSSSSATPAGNSITRTNTLRDPLTQKLTPLALLSNSKSTDFTAPLTSLDWNPISPSLIITSSIDTTCTIWDIPTLTAKTQLIAHDKEVYDVRFMSGSLDVFASCGADGSVRMFDLRSLEHSTIIYEPGVGKGASGDSSKEDGGSPVGGGGSPPPLLRLAASPHDTHLIATFSQDSNIVRILDVRQPGQALIELKGHHNSVNCVEWNPTRRGIIAAGADDSQVLIWDLINNPTGPANTTPGGTSGAGGLGQPNQERIPVASWRCDYEVNNISWSPSGASGGGEWLGVLGGRGIWGVKV
ncbi:WD40-repeat-containing domain protein [Morchella snyderi]|nr:WD40-repeat-containing domain protein [Morchella snyderi]